MIIGDTFLDYPDKESHALIVYMDGCGFNCDGCHNAEMQEFVEPSQTPMQLLNLLIDAKTRLKRTNKVILSGGDPLHKRNVDFTREFLTVNAQLKTPFEICIYTGHDFKSVPKDLKGFTFMKLGRYAKEKKQEQIKNDEFLQFASSNQILVDGNYKKISEGGAYFYV